MFSLYFSNWLNHYVSYTRIEFINGRLLLSVYNTKPTETKDSNKIVFSNKAKGIEWGDIRLSHDCRPHPNVF